MEDYQVLKLLSKAFEIGYTKAVVDYGDLKPQMSKNEAYQRYGRKTVDRWINEGLIKLVQDGKNSSRMRLDRIQLEIIAATSNRN